MTKPRSRVEAALYELCVSYGYCLGGEENDALIADPPGDPDAFLDAVLVAEGNDPTVLNKRQRDQLRQVVSDWLFDDGDGCGTNVRRLSDAAQASEKVSDTQLDPTRAPNPIRVHCGTLAQARDTDR
jgi:hypothetical protein